MLCPAICEASVDFMPLAKHLQHEILHFAQDDNACVDFIYAGNPEEYETI
jgi:hypothetical protein